MTSTRSACGVWRQVGSSVSRTYRLKSASWPDCNLAFEKGQAREHGRSSWFSVQLFLTWSRICERKRSRLVSGASAPKWLMISAATSCPSWQAFNGVIPTSRPARYPALKKFAGSGRVADISDYRCGYARQRLIVEEGHCFLAILYDNLPHARGRHTLHSGFGVTIAPKLRLVIKARQSDISDRQGFSKHMLHLGCIPPQTGPGVRVVGHDASLRSRDIESLQEIATAFLADDREGNPRNVDQPYACDGGRTVIEIVSEPSRRRGIRANS